ncbi:MAG: hypothetical protein KC431_16495 [Myxococcales bacterium]|nr:hypothetical protein [Myxococcales bacterium]
MASIPHSLLQHGYRHVGAEQAALDHLLRASDALNMALLTLEGSEDEGREAKLARIANARHFIVDAVTALARARVYVPGIRTYAINVVTTGERDVDRELGRLHQITTSLLWRNHAFLPAQRPFDPLSPEEEAQLAEVVRDLAAGARIERAMRHKWIVGAACFGLLAPMLGAALYLLALASATMAAVELARGAAPPALPAA